MKILKLGKQKKRRESFDREAYQGEISGLIGSFIAWCRSLYTEWPEMEKKLKDLPGTNYKLGVKYFREGRFADAIIRFRITVWLEPRHAAAHFKIGRCLHSLGERQKARAAYKKALTLRPDFTEAAFMIAVLDDGKAPSNRIPLPLVLEQFDRLAPLYRPIYVDRVGYNGHITAEKIMTDWVSSRLTADDNKVLARYDIIELGCGSGVTGERIRLYGKSTVGVDICKSMLDLIPAPSPGFPAIYDKIFQEEAGAFLTRQPHGTADIVISAGMFNYVGDLRDIIIPAGKILRSGGALIFSTERSDNESNAISWLVNRGSFGHSVSYLRQICQEAGLKEGRIDDIMLYRGAPGYQCLFLKP